MKTRTCVSRKSPCFLKRITCPAECPSIKPNDPEAKVCYINCNSPICKAECKHRKPNCNGPEAACLDPRSIGGDGIVFYFHGKSNEHFGLVSDLNLQINATPAATWDDEADHLKFTYDGKELLIPEGHFSSWESEEKSIMVERTSEKNSVSVTLPEIAEISVNVVPVTKEDDRIHNYQIPSDNCFAHLEVQFRFYGLSSKVEGVLGRTYQLDFQCPVKPGIAMPVVGGEDRYRTSSLLSADCQYCLFSLAGVPEPTDTLAMNFGTLDCTRGASSGQGIVCKK
ncbi:hypothetical protein SLE2022_394370 [Rubroshorea leprosula]